MRCADLAGPFQLLAFVKVKMAIRQVLGRTDLKRVGWAQKEAGALFTGVACVFSQGIFVLIFVDSPIWEHQLSRGSISQELPAFFLV